MIQETRKDPRAKVLSMTVRYKSATLDEFIEHHSHDISRGGMFIKTPAPFPGGTLLKFEVRIADEQKVVQGVGRVVWKRDASAASPDTPAGMGVKFIKLDDESKQLIDRLVAKRGGQEGAFDSGERNAENVPTAPQPQAATGSAPPAENRPIPIRKGTMIGLGAMQPSAPGTKIGLGDAQPSVPAKTPAPPAPVKTPPPPASASSDGGFFPKSEPLVQPPKEDQTVMRQAEELLRDALREAGGSLDEIGTAGTAPVVASPEPDRQNIVAPKPMVASTPPGKATSDRPAKAESAPPAAKTSTPPASIKPAASAASSPPGRSVSGPPASTTPSRRPLPSAPESRSYQRESGGKGGLWMLVAVVAIGGGIFFFAQRNKPEPVPEPAEPATQAPAMTAAPAPEPSATPEPSAAAAPEPSAAPSASAVPETPAEKAAREKAEAAAKKEAEAAAKKAEADAKKAEAEAKKAAEAEAKKEAAAAKKAELEAKKAAQEEALRAARAAAAARVAAAKPAAKPAAPAEQAPAPTTDKQETAPAAPAEKPTAEKPAAPEAPAATASAKPKPAPTAAPAKPAPAPKSGEDDNPY